MKHEHMGTDEHKVEWSADSSFSDSDYLKVKADPKKYIDWPGGIEFNDATKSIKLLPFENLVVNAGIQTALDRLFSINGPPAALTRIGVDNGTTAPTATSVSSDAGGGTDTGSSSQTLRTFDATPTRASNVVTALGTFNDPTTGGIGAVGFIMKRLFLSRHTANITNTTSADASGTLYSMTGVFTIDFTAISTWSIVFSATVTGAGA